MSSRFVAIDDGPDITLDRAMIVVGRHPNCDTRLNSLRVSRHHCCIAHENDEVVVRDLGSTNGIRINGMRKSGTGSPDAVMNCRLVSLRYRLEGEEVSEQGDRSRDS